MPQKKLSKAQERELTCRLGVMTAQQLAKANQDAFDWFNTSKGRADLKAALDMITNPKIRKAFLGAHGGKMAELLGVKE